MRLISKTVSVYLEKEETHGVVLVVIRNLCSSANSSHIVVLIVVMW